VRAIAADPRGRAIFVGFEDGTLQRQVPFSRTGTTLGLAARSPLVRITAETEPDQSLRRMLAVDAKGQGQLWKTGDNPEPLQSYLDLSDASICPLKGYIFARSTEGRPVIWLAGGGEGKARKEFDLPGPKPNTSPPPGVFVAAWHPTQRFLVAANVGDNKIMVWKLGYK
jgi:hypothetical protein